MNDKQQELLDRLKKALGDISKGPKTAAQVVALFEDFVISFEEIASDLKTTPDEEIAATLKLIAHVAGNPPK